MVFAACMMATPRPPTGQSDAPTAAAAAVARDEPRPVRPTEAVKLFNGRSLDGFETWQVDSKHDDPRGVFTVKDGAIRISGDGFGYLATKQRFRDYHLIVEFRWGERNLRNRVGKARDSGIFLHATGPHGNSYDGDGAYMAAIECNVMEGAVGDFLLIKGKDARGRNIPIKVTADVANEKDADGWFTWRPDAREYDKRVTLDDGGRINWFGKDPKWRDTFGFRGRNDVEKKAGEWNTVECICDGGTITIKVNGTVVNQVRDVQPRAGRILLQCEGSEVFYRRVELKPVKRDVMLGEPHDATYECNL